MVEVLYQGRKRKVHKGTRGGRYVIVKGEKRYLKSKASTRKKTTKKASKKMRGGEEFSNKNERDLVQIILLLQEAGEKGPENVERAIVHLKRKRKFSYKLILEAASRISSRDPELANKIYSELENEV
jgi:hypothetical protein